MDYGYGYGYDYYDVGSTVATGFGAILGFMAFIYIVALAVGIFSIVCNWKVYKKAGKQGWEAIVPIYNIIVLLQITGQPMWYIALLFVPIANIVVMFLIYIELAKKFGQSTGFGIGLVLLNPIFMAILAFNKNYVYQTAAPIGQPVQQPVGQPMYNQSMQQPVGQPVQQPVGQPMYNQPVQQSIPGGSCPNCGAPTNSGDKFCMNCGNQL